MMLIALISTLVLAAGFVWGLGETIKEYEKNGTRKDFYTYVFFFVVVIILMIIEFES